MSWPSKPKSGQPAASRADRSAEASDMVAAFLARGGQIKAMPAVVPTEFACSNCGHVGVIGMTEGKSVRRCPKCKEPLA